MRLRGDTGVVEFCRREATALSMNYCWLTEFLEAGKIKRQTGEIACRTTFDEVRNLHKESCDLKEVVAEQILKADLNKKVF